MSYSFKSLCGLLAILAPLSLSLGGCGCGFDCNNGNNNGKDPALLSLGFSDSIPEELKQVVIEVDTITLRRSGAEDVVIDQFTIDEMNLVNADTFQIDLLQYRGRNQLEVISDLELDTGTYSGIAIDILGGDVNHSFVMEADDSLKPITVAASGLLVPGMTLGSGSEIFTVEFGLAQSLRLQTGTDSYLMTIDGIRTEDNAVAASLSGRVASSLFDSVAPCDEKSDPEAGNRVYIYQGSGLRAGRLADVFSSASATEIPDDAIAPFAVAALAEDVFTGTWQYVFGFLPAGDYTLAFACDTATDDSVDFDDLELPLPADQVYEITLDEAQQSSCDLGENADCNNP